MLEHTLLYVCVHLKNQPLSNKLDTHINPSLGGRGLFAWPYLLIALSLKAAIDILGMVPPPPPVMEVVREAAAAEFEEWMLGLLERLYRSAVLISLQQRGRKRKYS